jgi:shikimate kinase
VFYNVWAELKVSDWAKLAKLKEKELLVYVQLSINETMRRMNEEIPRPGLKGVTPGDVLKGMAGERIELNRKYLEMEQGKKEVIEPWNRKDWRMVKKNLFKGTISNLEFMTKFCFFLKRPLRKLANLECELLGT